MQDGCNENLRDLVKSVYEDIELIDGDWVQLKNALREVIINLNKEDHTSS